MNGRLRRPLLQLHRWFGVVYGAVVWFVFGLAPAVLFVTGLITWWRRVVRPRWAS